MVALLLALLAQEGGAAGEAGGARAKAAEAGYTVSLEAVYGGQYIAAGGIDGTPLESRSKESDFGNTASFTLGFGIDAEKAWGWTGGSIDVRLEGRVGRSAVERAGTLSVINLDAVFPNVEGRFDEETMAFTTVSVTQALGGGFSLFGGLINASEGDANEIGGHALSANHFMNSAMLYSLVEDSTVPNAVPGGGILWEGERVSGSISAFSTTETAGQNPFKAAEGLTLATEWTVSYTLGGLGGAQTFGFLYGEGVERADLAANTRIVLVRLLLGGSVPTTDDSTWAVFYNAHQYLSGDAEKGWGLFVRAGYSDGNPNPVEWTFALGAAGRGTFPGRDRDAWGAGGFMVEASDEDLLQGLGLDHELGAEAYYTLSVTEGFRVTLDVQVLNSIVSAVDTTWVLGLRTTFEF